MQTCPNPPLQYISLTHFNVFVHNVSFVYIVQSFMFSRAGEQRQVKCISALSREAPMGAADASHSLLDLTNSKFANFFAVIGCFTEKVSGSWHKLKPKPEAKPAALEF